MDVFAGRRQPGREGWRKPTLVAASVALHGLVLGYLALTAVGVGGLDPVATPRIFIPLQLEPRPLLPNERVREPAPPRSVVPERIATAATATPSSRRPEEDEARPAPPAPRLALPAPGAPPIDDGWRVRPQPPGTGPALRPGGCSLPPGRLTQAERSACDARFGAAALGATPIRGTGNPVRDARFAAEGAQAMAAYESLRRPASGNIGVIGPTDGVGSNFGMGVAGAHMDPSLRPDSTENIRTNRRDGPRD